MISAATIFSAHAQDIGSAERFLRQLYADEAKLDPGPRPDAIYDHGLLALILREREYGHKYGKALLRVDPICVCQDPDGLHVQTITVRPDGPDRADATVSFAVANDRNVVDYALVKVDGQWRIHDILKGVTPSLRQYLITGLARERREIGKADR